MSEDPKDNRAGLVDKIARAAAILAIVVMLLAFAADLYVSRTTPKPVPPTPTITLTRKPSPTFTVTTTPYFQQRLNEPPIDGLLSEDLMNPLIERDFICSGYELSDDQYYQSVCKSQVDDVSYSLTISGLGENRVDFLEASVTFAAAQDLQLVSDYFAFISVIPQAVILKALETPQLTPFPTVTPRPENTPLVVGIPLSELLPTPVSTFQASTSGLIVEYLVEQIENTVTNSGLLEVPVAIEANDIYYQVSTDGSGYYLRVGIPIIQ